MSGRIDSTQLPGNRQPNQVMRHSSASGRRKEGGVNSLPAANCATAPAAQNPSVTKRPAISIAWLETPSAVKIAA